MLASAGSRSSASGSAEFTMRIRGSDKSSNNSGYFVHTLIRSKRGAVRNKERTKSGNATMASPHAPLGAVTLMDVISDKDFVLENSTRGNEILFKPRTPDMDLSGGPLTGLRASAGMLGRTRVRSRTAVRRNRSRVDGRRNMPAAVT